MPRHLLLGHFTPARLHVVEHLGDEGGSRQGRMGSIGVREGGQPGFREGGRAARGRGGG